MSLPIRRESAGPVHEELLDMNTQVYPSFWAFIRALVPAIEPVLIHSLDVTVAHPAGLKFLLYIVMKSMLSWLRNSFFTGQLSIADTNLSSSTGDATHPPAP